MYKNRLNGKNALKMYGRNKILILQIVIAFLSHTKLKLVSRKK